MSYTPAITIFEGLRLERSFRAGSNLIAAAFPSVSAFPFLFRNKLRKSRSLTRDSIYLYY